MLEALISHFTNGNKAQFAKLLGVSPQTISAWIARNTFDSELIYAKCRYINPSWLLTGQGNMLTNDENTQNVKSSREAIPAIDGMPNDIKPIPLVTERAAAGFGNECFAIQKSDVKDYYIIPKFRFCQVDFMIEVSGLSILVKRIMPSEQEGCFKIVSDNKDFPPFDLPTEEITGLALVVGCVSLE